MMQKKLSRKLAQVLKPLGTMVLSGVLFLSGALGIVGAGLQSVSAQEAPIILRICSWEEYIDEGDWSEEEAIDLDSDTILGENSVVEDFEEWFRETYGREVQVQYSTAGTNEEMYTQLTLGDEYDLICPSEYLIMKLMAEGMLEPLSEEFFDTENPNNYYINGVSPYIQERLQTGTNQGESWSKYAAGYMWGTTGIVYNPEVVSEEDASTWSILTNKDYYRQVTIKDNVRDALFPVMAILNEDKITEEAFRNSETYSKDLEAIINNTDVESVNAAEKLLQKIRGNVYSFETDSGKADMVSGKVVANLQWSGDAVYSMDQADEDDFYLCWAVPEECTNLWIDAWCMLKKCVGDDPDRKMAAEAFINFVSRPDIVIRNMYYIGYTSAIAGGEDSRIFEYAEWNYSAEDDEEDTVEYPLGYFFVGDNSDEDYILTAPSEALHRQLSAQYPSEEEISRSAIMQYFDDEASVRVNQMWINVRCFNLSQITGTQWLTFGGIVLGVALLIGLFVLLRFLQRRKNIAKRNQQ